MTEKDIEKIEKIIDSVPNPYPEDLFSPIDKKLFPHIDNYLQKQFSVSLARLSGNIGRFVFENTKKDIIKKLKEKLEEE